MSCYPCRSRERSLWPGHVPRGAQDRADGLRVQTDAARLLVLSFTGTCAQAHASTGTLISLTYLHKLGWKSMAMQGLASSIKSVRLCDALPVVVSCPHLLHWGAERGYLSARADQCSRRVWTSSWLH